MRYKVVIYFVESKKVYDCEAKMQEILNFVREILMLGGQEKMPVGLCAFETGTSTPARKMKKTKKREMRLSELMDK